MHRILRFAAALSLFCSLAAAQSIGSSNSATTQPTLNSTNSLANTQFVNNELIRAKATQNVPVSGGIYNTASTGTGLQVVVFATGGSISSILSLAAGGSGYLVGDTLRLAGGNVDAIVRVTNEVGGVVQSGGVQVMSGGTGYTTGVQLGAQVPPVIGNESVVYTGSLSSNVTIIQPAGTYLTGSRQVVYINDTTGPYTLSVFLSNGAGGTIGSGIVIPQGTSTHSCDTYGETDGVNDIWYAALPTCGLATASVNLGVLSLAGAGSYASWSTTSPVWNIPAETLTDNTGSGTIALRGAYTINTPTFASSSAETLTAAASLYLPVAVCSGNVTCTNAYALYTNGGVLINTGSLQLMNGSITIPPGNSFIGGALQVTGSTVRANGLYLPATNQVGFSTNTTAAGDIDANQHWRIGGSGTPTIASGACGTGANGTIATNGNDQSFEVLIGSTATTTCTITFASAFTTAPRSAQLTPADSAAAVVGTTEDYVSSLNTTTLVISGAALANADYYVMVY